MCDGQDGVIHSFIHACAHSHTYTHTTDTGDSMIALDCSSEPVCLLLVQFCHLMSCLHVKREPESRCTEDDRASERVTAEGVGYCGGGGG